MTVRGHTWGQQGSRGKGRPVPLMSLPAQQSPEAKQRAVPSFLPFLEEAAPLLK